MSSFVERINKKVNFVEDELMKRKPYLKIGHAEFIKEEMEIRSWDKKELARALNLKLRTVNELLKNKQRMTIDLAKRLSKAFNQSFEYWLNISKE